MHFLDKEAMIDFVRQRAALFDASGQQNPFSCSAWVLHFIEQVADANWRFTIPDCHADGESLMLLYSKPDALDRSTALTNYYASLYAPLISSASDRGAALACLVRQLTELRPRCATANLAPLDQEATDLLALRRAFSDHRWYLKQYFCFGNWYLPCEGMSFEQYMEQRPSELYNTWARKSKKFVDGQSAQLEIITDPEATEAALAAFQRVYAKSWKKPEPYPHFVPRWAKICARNGWLRLGIASVGHVPIAAQFWFTMHRRAYIFKLAYDDEYSKWSAGTVLTAHMIKYSLEQDRVHEIDYLTGDDAYKRSWMTARRERIGVLACNLRSPRGLMIAGAELAGAVRRRWRRPLRRVRNNFVAT